MQMTPNHAHTFSPYAIVISAKSQYHSLMSGKVVREGYLQLNPSKTEIKLIQTNLSFQNKIHI